jgi:hypothetical protein
MSASPKLQLGWLLDMPRQKVPVYLNAPGLTAHTAVIAQSGSGKSFMLGRFLEEIASKTLARTVILDPNSDFVKFSVVNPQAWKKDKLRESLGEGDNKDLFERRWGQIKFQVLTERNRHALALSGDNIQVLPLSLLWSHLAFTQKADFLGLSVRTNPEEWNALLIIRGVGEAFAERNSAIFDLSLWEKTAGDLLRATTHEGGVIAGDSALAFVGQKVPPAVAAAVHGRLIELNSLGLWDKSAHADTVTERMKQLAGSNGNARVACLDLGSLPRPEQRFVVAGAALEALWDTARTSWMEAMKKEPEDDSRLPIFIVIDRGPQPRLVGTSQ